VKVQRVPDQMSAMEVMVWTMRPILTPVAEDYERAAEILRDGGLAKGVAEDVDGGMCAGGVMVAAMQERLVGTDFRIEGSRVAEDMELDGYVCVQDWNDEPERTQEQVIERLEFAAKKLRNEGRS